MGNNYKNLRNYRIIILLMVLTCITCYSILFQENPCTRCIPTIPHPAWPVASLPFSPPNNRSPAFVLSSLIAIGKRWRIFLLYPWWTHFTSTAFGLFHVNIFISLIHLNRSLHVSPSSPEDTYLVKRKFGRDGGEV